MHLESLLVAGVYGDTLRALSGLDSSPRTRRWMLCNSLLDSFPGQALGDSDTEPDERLVISGSRAAEASPFRSMGGTAAVNTVLSGTLGTEYGLYRNRGRTAFRNGCRWTDEEEAAAAAAMYV